MLAAAECTPPPTCPPGGHLRHARLPAAHSGHQSAPIGTTRSRGAAGGRALAGAPPHPRRQQSAACGPATTGEWPQAALWRLWAAGERGRRRVGARQPQPERERERETQLRPSLFVFGVGSPRRDETRPAYS